MKALLLATHNPAKLEELKLGVKPLKDRGWKILTLNDVGVEENPEESGSSFLKNAEIKAKFYGQLTQLPTIADDGGLTVPYLGNEPGVRSRRWLGYEATDEELINHTLKHLRGVKRNDRRAFLQVCLCFFDPKTKIIIYEEEKIKGYITEKPSKKRVDGYPFRSLFIVEIFNKYYDDLTEKEHQQINHRLIAAKRLVKKIKEILIK